MKLEALNNNLIVDLIQPTNRLSGIALPENRDTTLRWAKVTSAGPGVYDALDTLITPDAKVGDVIYSMAHGLEDTDTGELGDPKTMAISMLDVLVKLVDLEALTIEPFGNYVEIQKLKRPATTKMGFLLPDSSQPPPNLAIVKSVGQGWFGATGKRIPVGLEPKDVIAYKPYETLVIDFSTLGVNKQSYLVSVRSILARMRFSDSQEYKGFSERYQIDDGDSSSS